MPSDSPPRLAPGVMSQDEMIKMLQLRQRGSRDERPTTGRDPVEHILRCWPVFFQAMLDRRKPFDTRVADRDYRVGDTLRLQEYDPDSDSYSGRQFVARVTYAMPGGQFGIDPGFVVLGVEVP